MLRRQSGLTSRVRVSGLPTAVSKYGFLRSSESLHFRSFAAFQRKLEIYLQTPLSILYQGGISLQRVRVHLPSGAQTDFEPGVTVGEIREFFGVTNGGIARKVTESSAPVIIKQNSQGVLPGEYVFVFSPLWQGMCQQKLYRLIEKFTSILDNQQFNPSEKNEDKSTPSLPPPTTLGATEGAKVLSADASFAKDTDDEEFFPWIFDKKVFPLPFSFGLRHSHRMIRPTHNCRYEPPVPYVV